MKKALMIIAMSAVLFGGASQLIAGWPFPNCEGSCLANYNKCIYYGNSETVCSNNYESCLINRCGLN